MIVYKNKDYVTDSKNPDSDFIGNADWVIPDGSELADKIKRSFPDFDFVFDDGGNLIDVAATEPQPIPEKPPVITMDDLAAAIAELAEVICGG